MDRRLSLAIVVQRYGADINGGAELHARYLAEHLAPHADVRVLTTCARDYITWENEFPAGFDTVHGIPVERFPVSRIRQRDLVEFGRQSTLVFTQTHSIQDELEWLDIEGPVSPALLERVADPANGFDLHLVFSLRYHCAYHACRVAPSRTLLVPTMEREAAAGLAILPPVLRGVRGIMYNSPEERAMLNALASNHDVPGVVVGVGSEVPRTVDPQRARQRFGLNHRFFVYVGRIDVNKGCADLFSLFLEYLRMRHLGLKDDAVDLVLIGNPVLPIPEHPRVRHLGYVSDAEKFDVMAASEALIMPSYFESLSMVALEAWALGKPVVANAQCDVLVGQCLRSNAGLYYDGISDFAGVLDALLERPDLGMRLGERGRRFFAEHYSWPVIERKYLDMLDRLVGSTPARPMEPLPGRLARRRRHCPPAATVLDSLRRGPVAGAVPPAEAVQ